MVGNLSTIRNEGYRILTQGLGAAGAIVFLRQFENGNGDYTNERRTKLALDENSVDAIASRIKKRKEK
jgi:hypothetical protein